MCPLDDPRLRRFNRRQNFFASVCMKCMPTDVYLTTFLAFPSFDLMMTRPL